MPYTIVIGMEISQRFENGDVVPQYTAISGDSCCTIIPCVGKAPATLKHDEPIGEMSYHEWKNLLMLAKGLRMLAIHIETNKMQIIRLNQPSVKEIIGHIKTEILKLEKSYYLDRAEWLIFWSEESIKRYGKHAAIGLF